MESITKLKNNTVKVLVGFRDNIMDNMEYIKSMPNFIQSQISQALDYLESEIKYLESETENLDKITNKAIWIFERCMIVEKLIEIIYTKINHGYDSYNKSILKSPTIISNKTLPITKFANIYKSTTKLSLYLNSIQKTIHTMLISEFDSGDLDINKFNDTISKYQYSWIIYVDIMQYILDADDPNLQKLHNEIMKLNEMNKTLLLDKGNTNPLKGTVPLKGANPPLLRYGLVPISPVMEISDIVTLVWSSNKAKPKISNPAIGVINDFIELCKKKQVDLILIRKHLGRGVNYNIAELLDYTKSKEYDKENNTDNGINLNGIKRTNTIQYISEPQNGINFNIDYQYTLNTDYPNLLILEELYPGKFHIMSNELDLHDTPKYIIKKSQVKEFIEFVNNGIGNRIQNYNKIINRYIMKNVYLKGNVDIDKLKPTMSYMSDITYLKYNINKTILDKYNQISSKGGVHSLYHFSKIIHMGVFVDILTNYIHSEYKKYTNHLIEINNTTFIDHKDEIDNQALYTITNYKRDFTKRIHDYFITEIPTIDTNTVTAEAYRDVFKGIVTNALDVVLSDNNNLYNIINNKLSIWKIIS
jgi:hypothetical protein